MVTFSGVTACVVGNGFMNAGRNVILVAQRKQKTGDFNLIVGLVTIGVALCSVGAVLIGLSLAVLPQIVVACLCGLDTVFSLGWWKFCFNFKPSTTHVLGIISILLGCTSVLFNSRDLDTPLMNPSQLFHAYDLPSYRIYLLMVCVLHFLFNIYNSIVMRNQDSSLFNATIFSISSASLGTQSIVMSKTLAMLARLAVEEDFYFLRSTFNLCFISFVFFVGVVSFLFWKYSVASGESHYTVNLFKPVNDCTWIIFTALSGGIYFREISHLGSLNSFYSVSLVAVGIILAFKDGTDMCSEIPSPAKEKLPFLNNEDCGSEASNKEPAVQISIPSPQTGEC